MKDKQKKVNASIQNNLTAPHSLKIMLSSELILDLFLCRYYNEKELDTILAWLESRAKAEAVQFYISQACVEKIHLYLGCLNPQAAENALIFLEEKLDIQVFSIDLDVDSIRFNLNFPCVDYLFEIKGAIKSGINLIVTLRPDLYFQSGLRVTSTGLVLKKRYTTEELFHLAASSPTKDRLRKPLGENLRFSDALRDHGSDLLPTHGPKADNAILNSDIFLDSEALSELFLNIYLEQGSRQSLLDLLINREGNIYVSRFGVEKLNFHLLKLCEQVVQEANRFLRSPKVKVLDPTASECNKALKEKHGNNIGLSLEAAISVSHGLKVVVTCRRDSYEKYRIKSFYLEYFEALLKTKPLDFSSKGPEDTQQRKDVIHFLHEFCTTKGQNFSGENLSGQNLSNFDLKNANFSGAILHRTNLSQANLEGANFEGADLSLADLSRANLKGANLDSAYMEFSDLCYANLFEASLKEACLNFAKLDYAEVRSAKLNRAKLIKSSLKGSVFNDADLSYADLNQSNIEGATFYRTTLIKANLTSCNLRGTALKSANLSGTTLEKANLIRTDLTYASLDRASLKGATINNSILKFASLRSADFRPLMSGKKIRATELICVSLFKADLRQANLSGVVARRTNFNNADLTGTTIQKAKLLNTSFLDAILDNAHLVKSDFGGALFTKASLINANLEEAKLESAYLDRAVLDGACLKRAELERAFLGEASLQGANLSYCNARWANFKDADLTGAVLERAQLFNANLKRARLTKADLNNALLEGTDLYKADLEGANLSSALLRGSILKSATLVDALLIGAQMQGAYFKDANLYNANLSYAGLNYSRFKRAILSHTNLHKARLMGADLRFAQLQHANLKEACLEEANMSCAVLISANLTLADLRNANVASAIFANADLSYAKLAGADLNDTNLTQAKLVKTDLSRAKLMASNLTGADLTLANLRLAWLSDADISNANLNSTIFTRTNLNGVNATGANLNLARIEECTTLGAYIDHEKDTEQPAGVNNSTCSYQDRLLDAEEAVDRLNDALNKLKNVKQGFEEKLKISDDFVEVAVYLSTQISLAEVETQVAKKILEGIGIEAQTRYDLDSLDLPVFSRKIHHFILKVSKMKCEIMKVCTTPRSFYSLESKHSSTDKSNQMIPVVSHH